MNQVFFTQSCPANLYDSQEPTTGWLLQLFGCRTNLKEIMKGDRSALPIIRLDKKGGRSLVTAKAIVIVTVGISSNFELDRFLRSLLIDFFCVIHTHSRFEQIKYKLELSLVKLSKIKSWNWWFCCSNLNLTDSFFIQD